MENLFIIETGTMRDVRATKEGGLERSTSRGQNCQMRAWCDADSLPTAHPGRD